jgi:hypothetical protein
MSAPNRLGRPAQAQKLLNTPPQHGPEEPIETMEFWARLLPLEHNQLLPQGSRFQCESVTRHEQGTDVGEDRNNDGTYRPDVNRPSSRATIFNVLILRTDLVLRTHRSPAS